MSLSGNNKCALAHKDRRKRANRGRRKMEALLAKIRENGPDLFESYYPDDSSSLFPVSIDATCSEKYNIVSGILAGISSTDQTVQLDQTTLLHELFLIDPTGPSSGNFMHSGIVRHLAQFLMRENQPKLRSEAACVLEILVPGITEYTEVGINDRDHRFAQILVNLLISPIDLVRNQAVRALRAAISNSAIRRDRLLNCGALDLLLKKVTGQTNLSMLRHASHTLFILCRGNSQLPVNQIRPALTVLQELICSEDEMVLTHACWALSYLRDNTNDKICAVIDANVCPRLVDLLKDPSPCVHLPALRTVAVISAGDDWQTQTVIDCGALQHMRCFLTNNHEERIKKLACRIISNITAGNKDQIQSVIAAQLISPLVTLLQTEPDICREEAAWAIFNATSCGSRDQIKCLVSEGCIKSLCDLLICPDPRIVTVCLKGLENILNVGESEKNPGNTRDVNIYVGESEKNPGNTRDVNIYVQLFHVAGGVEKINNLRSHDNNEICTKAAKILETFQ